MLAAYGSEFQGHEIALGAATGMYSGSTALQRTERAGTPPGPTTETQKRTVSSSEPLAYLSQHGRSLVQTMLQVTVVPQELVRSAV